MAKSARSLVAELFSNAITKAFPQITPLPKMLVVPCQKAEQGDYQCNNAMGLHKLLQQKKKEDPSIEVPAKPQDVAQALVKALPEDSIIDPTSVQVAGPGFINIKLKNSFLSNLTRQFVEQGRVAPPYFKKQEVAVDFSSPNLAKEMHIGHLRSTIIGEAICRILEYCGHNVHRINHVGDWGTQFGMLIAHLKTAHPDWQTNPPPLKDLVTFYKEAKKRFDADPEFKKQAQLEVVALQADDETNLSAWRWLTQVSKEANQVLYDRLSVTLEDRGESWYNKRMPPLIQRLTADGLIKESQGARVIWVDPEESKKPPLIMQKSDGGFGYATTDMAALDHRINEMKCDRLVYVIDAGQEAHIQAFFKAGRMAGWTSEEKGPQLVHAKFGVVCGEDGKKFKTRSGDTVLLGDVLDEARDKAKKIMMEKDEERKARGEEIEAVTSEELDRVSELIGVNAVKYFDLRQNRTTDYQFSYDRMLELKGNTAVYLLYTYARIRSLGRKAGLKPDSTSQERLQQLELGLNTPIEPSLGTKQERALALFAIRFYEVIEDVHEELFPHKIAEYLYQLCENYSSFYEECPVLKAEEPLRSQRIVMCEAVAVVLKQALRLLGIPTLERL